MENTPEAPRRTLLAGAGGLVGGHLAKALLDAGDVARLISLVRRPAAPPHPKLEERVVDFAALPPAESLGPLDDVHVALGSTLAKAGSREAFRRVDYDAVLAVARLGREAGARRLILVSSVGADARSGNFYLRVKGEAEEALATLGYSALHLLRPSMLLGDRQESRPAERAGQVLMRLAGPLLHGPLGRYHAVAAEEVAAAMLGAARVQLSGRCVHHYQDILSLAARGRGV